MRTKIILNAVIIISLFFISCSETEINAPVTVLDAPSHLQLELLKDHIKLLSWKDNSSLEEGYCLEIRINNKLQDTVILPSNTVNYIDSTTAADTGKIITFILYAFKDELKSDEDTISFSQNGLMPPSELLIKSEGSGITLFWTDNSDTETGYIVEKRSRYFDYTIKAELPANTTSFIDTSLDTSLIYSYRVRAVMNSSSSNYVYTNELSYGVKTGPIYSIEDTYGVQKIKFIPGSDLIVLGRGTNNPWTNERHLKILKRDGSFVREIPESGIFTVSYSGKYIAVSRKDADIKIFNINTGELIKTINRRNKSYNVLNIAMHPSDSLIAVYEQNSEYSYNGNLDAFNVSDGSLRYTINTNYIRSTLDFTPDGNYLYYCEFNDYIRKVNAFTGELISSIVSNELIWFFVFSPTGKYILWSHATGYNIKDLQTGKFQIFPESSGKITDVTFIEPADGSPYYIDYSIYSGGAFNYLRNESNIRWRININSDITPAFIAAFQNIQIYPDEQYAIGYGWGTNVKIIKLLKGWKENK